MLRRTPGRAILAAPLILLLLSAGIFAQGSSSNPNDAASAPSANQSSQAGSRPTMAAQAAPDAEPEAFSKAMGEGRLVDAENLVNAAIEEESKSQSSQRMRDLLEQLGNVESQMGHFAKAVEAVNRAMAIDREQSGPRSTRVMLDFRELAFYSGMQGDYAASFHAAEQELALARENPGQPDPRYLLMALEDAARAAELEKHTDQAQALREETLRICQEQPHPELVVHPCASLLADANRKNGNIAYGEETLSKQAGATPVYGGTAGYWPKVLTLITLAHQYEKDHSYELEEATDRQAIAVVEAAEKNPVEAASSYDSLGHALELEARDDDAEAAYQHAFDLREHATGDSRSAYIESLTDTPLPALYRKEGRVSDAETVLKRVLADQEQALDARDDRLPQTLLKLAEVKSMQSETSEAEALAERALSLQESNFGPDSPKLIPTLMACSEFARQMREFDKAKALAARAERLNPYFHR